jgi:membrane protein YqaA with SNARE-associated domain
VQGLEAIRAYPKYRNKEYQLRKKQTPHSYKYECVKQIACRLGLLIDWGYAGLFISALLAGSIIPFSSELVMLALVKVGLNPAICVLAATLGNTMGGMTCYYMGHLGKTDWIEKYFKVKQEKIDKMQRFLQGKGALMAFFAFLPFIGEAIAIALGFMRSNVMLTSLSMFTGKLVRYIVMLSALQGALSVMSV